MCLVTEMALSNKKLEAIVKERNIGVRKPERKRMSVECSGSLSFDSQSRKTVYKINVRLMKANKLKQSTNP